MLIDPRLRDDSRPVVGVDIDGVLNLWTGRSTISGLRYRRRWVQGYRITWRADLLDLLAPLVAADEAGEIQLAWATMWEDLAQTDFAPAVLNGLGADWPVIYFSRPGESTLAERRAAQARHEAVAGWDQVYLKTPDVADFAHETGRRVVWIDDGVSFVDRDYLARRSALDDAPRVELVPVNEREGLTAAHVEYALTLAREGATV